MARLDFTALPRWQPSQPVIVQATPVGAPEVTSQRWVNASTYWQCKGCRRDKYEIVRRTKDGKTYGKIVIHHCHSHYLSGRVPFLDKLNVIGRLRVVQVLERFRPTEVCEDCNNADAVAKRAVGAPFWFSFAPVEIHEFIEANPYKNHVVINDAAQSVYERATARQSEIFSAVAMLAEAVHENNFFVDPTIGWDLSL